METALEINVTMIKMVTVIKINDGKPNVGPTDLSPGQTESQLSRRKLKTRVFLRLHLALGALAMNCTRFGRHQICTQVNES